MSAPRVFMRLRAHFIVFILTLLVQSQAAFAGAFSGDSTVQIPIKPTDTLPATDLLFTEASGTNINDAWEKEKSGSTDLSTLDPDPTSEFWDGTDHLADAEK